MVFFLLPLAFSSEYPRGMTFSSSHQPNADSFTKFYTQFKDHHNHEDGTFQQFYYETYDKTTGWVPGKPIILRIGSESDTLRDGYRDFVKTLGQTFNAKVLTLEHRYFGQSYVTPGESTYANLKKYLTVDQALEDLSTFAVSWQKEHDPKHLSKWIILGGSYPGLLSAYSRQRHPEIFHIGIASSAVVKAIDDFYEFDIQDAISLGPQCASLARTVVHKITKDFMPNNDEYQKLLKTFDMVGMPVNDFNFVLGEIFTIAHQYGKLKGLCSVLEDALISDSDAVAALGKYARTTFKTDACGGDCVKTYSTQELKKEKGEKLGHRNWMWMTCNEMAYWQTSPGIYGIRPQALTKDYFHQQCREVFDPDIPETDVDGFNKKYHAYEQNSTRMIYITGDQDPWTWACITEENKPNVKDIYVHTVVGEEQGHCPDMRDYVTDEPPDLRRTRQNIIKYISMWLQQEDK